MKRTTFETKFKKFLLQMNPNKIIFSKYMVYKKRSHLSFFFSPERVRVSLTILRISPSGHFINIPHKRNSYADTDYFSCVILFLGSDRSSSGLQVSGLLEQSRDENYFFALSLFVLEKIPYQQI